MKLRALSTPSSAREPGARAHQRAKAGRKVHDTPELLASIVDAVDLTPATLSALRRTSLPLAAEMKRPARLAQACEALKPFCRDDERHEIVSGQVVNFAPHQGLGVFGDTRWRVRSPQFGARVAEDLFPLIVDRIEFARIPGLVALLAAPEAWDLERPEDALRQQQGMVALHFIGLLHDAGLHQPLRCWKCDTRKLLLPSLLPRLATSLVVSSALSVAFGVGLEAWRASYREQPPAWRFAQWLHGPAEQRPLVQQLFGNLMLVVGLHAVGLALAGAHRVLTARAWSDAIEASRRQILRNIALERPLSPSAE